MYGDGTLHNDVKCMGTEHYIMMSNDRGWNYQCSEVKIIMHDFFSKNPPGFSTTGFFSCSFLSGGAKVTQNKWITKDF